MIPDVVCTIFSFSILAILFFVTYSVKKGNLRLIHRLFFTLALAMAVFMGALLVMRFMDSRRYFWTLALRLHHLFWRSIGLY